jgi:geranylgeranyl diphosphate synthase type I
VPNPLEAYLQAVEAAMRELLAAPSPAVEPLYGMMRYHLGWVDDSFRPVRASSGKRVRPLFCLLSCEAAGGKWQDVLPVAASIELIHNFSLIHDDIEDASPTRRHRPTVWAVWGVPQAINAGDAMFTLARSAVHGLVARGILANVILAVLQCLEKTSLALCEGQHLDMAFETRAEVSLADYMLMIEGKTASLLACATETGALVGAGMHGPHAAFREFGHQLGIAFQIVDDILGIWGDPAATGKPAAADIRSRKKTLPVLHALEVFAAQKDTRLATLLAQPALSEADVATAIAYLEAAGAREQASRLASAHTERALIALTGAAPPSPARDTLQELALSLTARER